MIGTLYVGYVSPYKVYSHQLGVLFSVVLNAVQFSILEQHPEYKISCFLQGTLKGFDQTINLILDDSHERVYSLTQGVEQVVLGLHIIRGDNMLVLF